MARMEDDEQFCVTEWYLIKKFGHSYFLPAYRVIFLTKAQGVVTYMSPVEAFATMIKFFDWQKVCLHDRLIVPF